MQINMRCSYITTGQSVSASGSTTHHVSFSSVGGIAGRIIHISTMSEAEAAMFEVGKEYTFTVAEV